MNKKILPPWSSLAKTIIINGVYEHYKGFRYKVLAIARHILIYAGLWKINRLITRWSLVQVQLPHFFNSFEINSFRSDDDKTSHQIQGVGMHHIEQQKEKFFIGLELRTNNEECSLAMPAHKDRFFKENIPSKIPNKINGNILALYTDYEGDYTMPYSWILGCEVANLDEVPEGLVGKVIPESKYAVFTTQGAFPQGLIDVWQEIWQSGLPRSYTSDFEVYRNDFDPQQNPEVKVNISIE